MVTNNEKLIVVGMRHCEATAAVAALNPKSYVSLRKEKNQHAASPGNIALRVEHQGYKIGYIRNEDLHNALKGGADLYKWKVESIRQNYIVLTNTGIPLEEIGVDNEVDAKSYTDGLWVKTSSSSISTPTSTGTIKVTDNLNHTNLKGINMINTNSMRDQFFREVKNVAIDIQSGKFGIKNTDGISVFVNGGISVNPIQELGVNVPAFAMRIAVDQLKAGDIIIAGNEASFFVEATKTGYTTINTKGEISEVGSVTNMFFGKNTVLAVKNMFEGSGMNPMMMALMLGDGKVDNKSLMLMAMMGGMGGNATDVNPMMMAMMLMGDK